jgi:nucleotide-binding universal stress UspA family protein
MGVGHFRSMLAASDLSEGSDDVVRTAAAVAARTGGRVKVVHAFEFSSTLDAGAVLSAPTFEADFARREQLLEQQIQRVVPEGVPATAEIVIRTPTKAILDCAADRSADLVVLGPHRHRAVADEWLGSTAEEVVRAAEVPCLVARGRFSLPLAKVVVGQDLSDQSATAIEVALRVAVLLGASTAEAASPVEIDVVHVVQPIPFVDGLVGEAEELRSVLNERIAVAVGRVPAAASLKVTGVVARASEPARGLVEHAEAQQANLIVMGTHGRGPIQRIFLGSVAAAVTRRANCPVLMIPPKLLRGQ